LMLDVKKILKRKSILIASIVLIGTLLLALNAFAGKEPDSQISDTVDTVTVEVHKAGYSDSQGKLTYKANLEPQEEAAVSSKVTGQVTGVVFENGDPVVQGQPLAYLDDEDLRNQLKSAQLDLNKLQLELDSAKRDYGNARELYEQGACSRLDYENAEQAYKTMQANVELRKVDITTIGSALEDCVIKAPISGEAGERSLNVGEYVNPGAVIAKVKNNTAIKATIQLMQDDLEKVAAGQEVTLKLDRNGGTSYKGTVKSVASSADSQTRGFDCLVEFDNTSGKLNSGTFGLIEIPDPVKRQVIAVPIEALTGSEGDYSVFVMKDNTARKIAVELGGINDETAEITSGLQEGDLIITTNLNFLQDGDKVTAAGEGA
ncbi:MAG TPA: efflux RND transporter periplasmic adaptor subunit, partial [Anaerovoracaceae bacterium]|nr:efflux RND transporter periplasmic adaptor subunit [Anaerovoracaceae bacterium]